MSDQPFTRYIEQERNRLVAERETCQAQITALEERLKTIDNELQAMSTYEAIKRGQPVPQRPAPQRTPRGRGNHKYFSRDQVLSVIRANPGMRRRALLERMGVKGDRRAEMSVSNALTALKNSGNIRREENGDYHPAAH